MQVVTTIGLDIAKSIFQLHGVDAEGNVVVRRKLKHRRDRLIPLKAHKRTANWPSPRCAKRRPTAMQQGGHLFVHLVGVHKERFGRNLHAPNRFPTLSPSSIQPRFD